MFGIESASQDVLDFYKKGISIEQARHAVRLAHQAGLLTLGFFIIGAPMEGEEHLGRTRRFLVEEPLDYVNINILGYYQGSELWQSAVERGLLGASQTIAYADERLSRYSVAQWQEQKSSLLNAFYARPAWMARIVWKCARTRPPENVSA